MKTFWGTLYVAAFIILLILLGRVLYIDYRINEDITVNLKRAQESASFDEMASELGEARQGLEKWRITRGHSALIFKVPQNDARLFYASLKKFEKDVKVLDNLNLSKDTSAYFTMLDDVQARLDAFDFSFTWHWFIHRNNLSLIIFFLILVIGSGAMIIRGR